MSIDRPETRERLLDIWYMGAVDTKAASALLRKKNRPTAPKHFRLKQRGTSHLTTAQKRITSHLSTALHRRLRNDHLVLKAVPAHLNPSHQSVAVLLLPLLNSVLTVRNSLNHPPPPPPMSALPALPARMDGGLQYLLSGDERRDSHLYVQVGAVIRHLLGLFRTSLLVREPVQSAARRLLGPDGDTRSAAAALECWIKHLIWYGESTWPEAEQWLTVVAGSGGIREGWAHQEPMARLAAQSIRFLLD
ncbi:hypothetical protein K490DRAFT_59648 [Saccharata proteae CBS 121410]|uniref:Uncharacterized protein n=1 Tax=Saccharata proteae CBS 121410 TaxID=1314787 RepID=A0A9P4LVR7_9PEZI|nr:hypothetical protein K490DRAFT_59648 [Saccharata proteae CBS 121410]